MNYPGFIFRTLCRDGCRVQSLLAGTGLTSEPFADPDFRIEFPVLQRFILNAIEVTGDPHLGPRLARRFEPSSIGLPAYAAMNAACLEDALEVLSRFFGLAFSSIDFGLSADRTGLARDEVAIVLRPRHSFQDIEYFVFSSALVVGHTLLKAILRAEHVILRAEIATRVPGEGGQLSAEIGSVPVLSGARENRLVIPAQVLSRPLPGADPIDHKRLLELCERLDVGAVDAVSLVNQVQVFLETGKNLTAPLSKTAEALGYSERSLRRYLEKSNTSYRKLVDEVRVRRAREMLAAGDQPIKAIAFALGYDTPSNFARSFKRWTGLTPRAFRESHSQSSKPGQK